MRVLNKLLHWWFPKRCSRDAPLVWRDNEIRCPVCGRLLAYRFLNPKGTAYEVFICFNSNLDEGKVLESANSDIIVTPLDPYGVEAALAAIHRRSDELMNNKIIIRKSVKQTTFKKRKLILHE